MMKMRISTPHYLEQLKGKASPFGFVLHPRTREELELTLLTFHPSGIYFVPQDSPRTVSFYDFATRRTRRVFTADQSGRRIVGFY